MASAVALVLTLTTFNKDVGDVPLLFSLTIAESPVVVVVKTTIIVVVESSIVVVESPVVVVESSVIIVVESSVVVVAITTASTVGNIAS